MAANSEANVEKRDSCPFLDDSSCLEKFSQHRIFTNKKSH